MKKIKLNINPNTGEYTDKIVIIQDEDEYYTIDEKNITDKIVDQNVIVAIELNDLEFEKKYGLNPDKYAAKRNTRHLVRTDEGVLFFDEETNEKILLGL